MSRRGERSPRQRGSVVELCSDVGQLYVAELVEDSGTLAIPAQKAPGRPHTPGIRAIELRFAGPQAEVAEVLAPASTQDRCVGGPAPYLPDPRSLRDTRPSTRARELASVRVRCVAPIGGVPSMFSPTVMAEAAVEDRPFFELHEAHAWALYRNSRFADAAKAIERAGELGIQDPELHVRAALIQHALGDDETASTELATAIQINPLGTPYLTDQDTQILDELIANRPA